MHGKDLPSLTVPSRRCLQSTALSLIGLLLTAGCTIQTADDDGSQASDTDDASSSAGGSSTAGSAGTGGTSGADETGADDGPGQSCDQPLLGTVQASDEIRDAAGVDRYEYAITALPTSIELDVRGVGDENLGVLVASAFEEDEGSVGSHFRFEAPGDEPAEADVEFFGAPGEEVGEGTLVDSSVWTVRYGGRVFLVRTRLGGDDDEAFRIEYAVPVGDVQSPPSTGGLDTTTTPPTYTFTARHGAYEASEEDVDAWLDEVGLTPLRNSESVNSMFSIYGDASWRDTTQMRLTDCFGPNNLVGSPGVLPPDVQLALFGPCWDAAGTTLPCTGCAATPPSKFKLASCVGCVLAVDNLPSNLQSCLCEEGVGLDKEGVCKTCTAEQCNASCICGGVCYLNDCFCNTNTRCCDGGCEPNTGRSTTDPHLLTFDGVRYSFQARGEFILVEAADESSFRIQARQEATSGACPNTSKNTAVAMQVGQHIVGVYGADGEPPRLRVDDGEASLLQLGEQVELDGGAFVEGIPGGYYIEWSDGESLKVTGRTHLNLDVDLPPHRAGVVRGLLGDNDGDASAEMRRRDGSAVQEPTPWRDVYSEFGDTWRIEQAESLFFYESGESTDTFQVPDFPARPFTVDDIEPEVRAEAEGVCMDAGVADPLIFADCVIDVACSNDVTFAESAATLSPIGDNAPILFPIRFSDWTVEGDPGNGNWVLEDDDSGVRQTVNGDNTFFVSPNAYDEVTITGRLLVEGSDDDYIGFAFGYQSPLQANGDAVDDYDMFLVSWKGEAQSFGGVFAEQGLTLARVQGQITDLLPNFWGQTSSPEYTVLDTDYSTDAEDRGWDLGVEYDFRLEYSTSEIRVFIDGVLSLEASADEVGAPFEPGRFGFYNYSQANVLYYDFAALE
ncbi:MAG: VWD domain-containing protein [Myxococcota bacterium]